MWKTWAKERGGSELPTPDNLAKFMSENNIAVAEGTEEDFLYEAENRVRAFSYKYGRDINIPVCNAIVKGLANSKIKYGSYYCPCKVITGDRAADSDNICMCRAVREGGVCHCGLYK